MKGTWRMEPVFTLPCPKVIDSAGRKCGKPIRAYRARKDTARRRIRSATSQHCTTHHPEMRVRERSVFADTVADSLELPDFRKPPGVYPLKLYPEGLG